MQETIELLTEAANLYKFADQKLDSLPDDPIASTVFAYKGKHLDLLSGEALDAGFYLKEVVRLTGVLIKEYGMNPDKVRNIYLPILNA